MLYPNGETGHPSLLVEAGKTVTVGAEDADILTVSTAAFRPRTLAALLVLCGMPTQTPARLSDPQAFEPIEKTSGLVDIRWPDADGRIGGHTQAFLRRVLENLDTDSAIPETVHLPVAASPRANFDMDRRIAERAPIAPVSSNISQTLRPAAVEVPVPHFVRHLSIFARFAMFDDIVVEQDATLLLNASLTYVIASNVLAYQGSRIVQQGDYMALDVSGRVVGGMVRIAHGISAARLVVDWLEVDRNQAIFA